MPRKPALFTQADISRALRALLQAGGCGAVEITREGTIRVIPYRDMLSPSERPVERKRELVL